MKKMKCIVSVFLCIALIVTAFGVSAPVQATNKNVKTKNVKLQAKNKKKSNKKKRLALEQKQWRFITLLMPIAKNYQMDVDW